MIASRNWTAIDATWWFGGSRSRGIGVYLHSYFAKHCHVPRSQRVWLVPHDVRDEEAHGLVESFGGQVLKLPSQASQMEEKLIEWKHAGCHALLFPSPFERPHSLVDFWPMMQKLGLRGEALVFDLLPWQFPQEILAFWPVPDQERYRYRVNILKELDFLWYISPATEEAVREALQISGQKGKVLSFGLNPRWIQIPLSVHQKKIKRDPKLVFTLTGGEWHKNLEGTLDYFCQHFRSGESLVVLCRLGWKRKFALKWKLFWKGALARVHFVQTMTEQEKWEHYLRATHFLFLSRAEGLGIPLLEAEKAEVPHIYMSSHLVKQGFRSLVTAPTIVETL